MALDKTKENTRIADLLAMGTEAVKTKMMVGIDNPSILKQFVAEEEINWDYAVAAGLLEKSDVEWIKEHVNEEDSEETPKEPGQE
jgi:hypothetical protein